MSPGDFELEVRFGEKFNAPKFLVVGNKGTVWKFDSEDELEEFFTGRSIEFYSLYNLDGELSENIEKSIYGESGRFDRFSENK